jgi:hypothetical protein
MSFYSALVLAANDGAPLETADVLALCAELGLLERERADQEFGNLADDITALFDDAMAKAQNPQFFCPDSISFAAQLQVLAFEDDYAGIGWCIRIHGNGYFYPWERDVLCERVVRSPKLLRLRHMVSSRFGGRFVFPTSAEPFLRERWIDGDDGWMWFACES